MLNFKEYLNEKEIERTKAYRKTVHDPQSDEGQSSIKKTRDAAKLVNKHHKKTNNPARYKVRVKGRYGKNNPNYDKAAADRGAVPLKHAKRVDVYADKEGSSGMKNGKWSDGDSRKPKKTEYGKA
jgi:hypothetical protein